MSTTLTSIYSAPVANYPSLQDAIDALTLIYGVADVQNLVSAARSAMDMEADPIVMTEEVGGNYVITITSQWVDQTTAEEHIADSSISGELAAAEEEFIVNRVFS
jgi:hypothetical protein